MNEYYITLGAIAFVGALAVLVHRSKKSDKATTTPPDDGPVISDEEALRTYYSTMTVIELKAELRKAELPVSGVKAQLIERLVTFYST